jgi:hypothetical protein
VRTLVRFFSDWLAVFLSYIYQKSFKLTIVATWMSYFAQDPAKTAKIQSLVGRQPGPRMRTVIPALTLHRGCRVKVNLGEVPFVKDRAKALPAPARSCPGNHALSLYVTSSNGFSCSCCALKGIPTGSCWGLFDDVSAMQSTLCFLT